MYPPLRETLLIMQCRQIFTVLTCLALGCPCLSFSFYFFFLLSLIIWSVLLAAQCLFHAKCREWAQSCIIESIVRFCAWMDTRYHKNNRYFKISYGFIGHELSVSDSSQKEALPQKEGICSGGRFKCKILVVLISVMHGQEDIFNYSNTFNQVWYAVLQFNFFSGYSIY